MIATTSFLKKPTKSSNMTVEYVVGRFLHEEHFVQHFIPEAMFDTYTPNIRPSSNFAVNRRRAKKAEWSTLRKSKHI